MEAVQNTHPKMTEAKARNEISWLVNEAFVTLNLGGTACCFDFDDDTETIARRVVLLCEMHPHLALEYYTVGDTGEKVTALEAFLRNHLDPNVIKEFCEKFPEVLQIKTYANQVYPLHIACEEVPHGGGHVLIPFLASSFPEAVWTTDNDGNLPLHKVLRRLAKAPRLATMSREAPEVEALVRLFPESTIARGMDLAGQDPLHFVLSHQFSAAVMKVIMRHIPETVTSFTMSDVYFAGGMASITREYAEAFQPFLPQLEHLVFKPGHTAVTPVFTAEGWVCFFEQLACCPNLEHLEMELPYALLKEDALSSVTFAETLPHLIGLQSLILSFPKIAPSSNQKVDEQSQVLLSKPIAELIKSTGASLRNLIVKDGISMDPGPILEAIIQHSDLPLVSLDIRSSLGNDHDLTQPLSALIASNSKLESLYVKNSKVESQPIFDALVKNTNLKSLALPSLITEASGGSPSDGNTDTLSNVLQNYNVSLEKIQCLDMSFQQSNSAEYKRIQHYASLNRFGRLQARKLTSNSNDVIELLVAAQLHSALKHREKERASVCYGLLLEAPTQWSGHHMRG